ncbi:hypothetical protein L484_006642 [Morus notabilis]|uniref:Uncharacterized protein n=1 Tax=Morus notabilis TaxID=981085 RepID=W9SKJ3_9ROSA|nr:hypothetical protein L484_006642 [Morus notabilis]
MRAIEGWIGLLLAGVWVLLIEEYKENFTLSDNSYAIDDGLGEKGTDVARNPGLSGGECCVSDGDNGGDAGTGECANDVGVGVEDLDLVDRPRILREAETYDTA